MQHKRKRDIENTAYSLCYDYFSSETFDKIPELVSYKSLKGLQPLISNKLLYERYANYHIQIRYLQFRLFLFFASSLFLSFQNEKKILLEYLNCNYLSGWATISDRFTTIYFGYSGSNEQMCFLFKQLT